MREGCMSSRDLGQIMIFPERFWHAGSSPLTCRSDVGIGKWQMANNGGLDEVDAMRVVSSASASALIDAYY